MKCSKCGYDNDNKTKFCLNCGRNLLYDEIIENNITNKENKPGISGITFEQLFYSALGVNLLSCFLMPLYRIFLPLTAVSIVLLLIVVLTEKESAIKYILLFIGSFVLSYIFIIDGGIWNTNLFFDFLSGCE